MIVVGIVLLVSATYVYFDAFQPRVTARRLIEKSGIKGGLIAHVGFENGKLPSAFHYNERFIVHGITRNKRKVRSEEHTSELQSLLVTKEK